MTYEDDKDPIQTNVGGGACRHSTGGGLAISNRINELMVQRGLTKLEFAQALGKRPSEVTKWLSGQHNFTIRTLSALSEFFGESLVRVC